MSYEIFERLCRDHGVTTADVSTATGILQGTFSHWKKGDYQPKEDKRRLIANYFGVSLEYLDTGLQPELVALSDEDRNLLQLVHDNPKLKSLLAISHELREDDFNKLKDFAERVRGSYKE